MKKYAWKVFETPQGLTDWLNDSVAPIKVEGLDSYTVTKYFEIEVVQRDRTSKPGTPIKETIPCLLVLYSYDDELDAELDDYE